MKLVKLTDDHYVVVDDSEIKEGDWYLIGRTIYHCIKNIPEDLHNENKIFKITHSTQPFEHGTEPFADGVQYVKIYDKIKPLSLQEVKELIGEKSWKGYIDGTEWEVEWETIDNRQPCDCSCHNNPNMIHFVACCNDGWIGKVTQKLKLK